MNKSPSPTQQLKTCTRDHSHHTVFPQNQNASLAHKNGRITTTQASVATHNMFAALTHDNTQRHDFTEDFPGKPNHDQLMRREALWHFMGPSAQHTNNTRHVIVHDTLLTSRGAGSNVTKFPPSRVDTGQNESGHGPQPTECKIAETRVNKLTFPSSAHSSSSSPMSCTSDGIDCPSDCSTQAPPDASGTRCLWSQPYNHNNHNKHRDLHTGVYPGGNELLHEQAIFSHNEVIPHTVGPSAGLSGDGNWRNYTGPEPTMPRFALKYWVSSHADSRFANGQVCASTSSATLATGALASVCISHDSGSTSSTAVRDVFPRPSFAHRCPSALD